MATKNNNAFERIKLSRGRILTVPLIKDLDFNERATSSNASTRNRNIPNLNKHLERRAVVGAKEHAQWVKDHPVLSTVGDIVSTTVATMPLSIGSGLGSGITIGARAASPYVKGLLDFAFSPSRSARMATEIAANMGAKQLAPYIGAAAGSYTAANLIDSAVSNFKDASDNGSYLSGVYGAMDASMVLPLSKTVKMILPYAEKYIPLVLSASKKVVTPVLNVANKAIDMIPKKEAVVGGLMSATPIAAAAADGSKNGDNSAVLWGLGTAGAAGLATLLYKRYHMPKPINFTEKPVSKLEKPIWEEEMLRKPIGLAPKDPEKLRIRNENIQKYEELQKRKAEYDKKLAEWQEQLANPDLTDAEIKKINKYNERGRRRQQKREERIEKVSNRRENLRDSWSNNWPLITIPVLSGGIATITGSLFSNPSESITPNLNKNKYINAEGDTVFIDSLIRTNNYSQKLHNSTQSSQQKLLEDQEKLINSSDLSDLLYGSKTE